MRVPLAAIGGRATLPGEGTEVGLQEERGVGRGDLGVVSPDDSGSGRIDGRVNPADGLCDLLDRPAGVEIECEQIERSNRLGSLIHRREETVTDDAVRETEDPLGKRGDGFSDGEKLLLRSEGYGPEAE